MAKDVDNKGEKECVERKITVKCGACDGDGQKGGWMDNPNEDAFDIWEVYTCGQCDGKGTTDILVHDYRTKETIKDEMVKPRTT